MFITCPECEGSGIQTKIYARNNSNGWFIPCYKCSGTGKIQVSILKRFLKEKKHG